MALTFGTTDASYGEVDGLYFYGDSPRIHIDARVTTKAHFLSTLAHEMVHQLQDMRGVPITHGVYFKRYTKRFLKYGLIL